MIPKSTVVGVFKRHPVAAQVEFQEEKNSLMSPSSASTAVMHPFLTLYSLSAL